MTKPFKIGLYVRVSTEEQAENPEGSIKNQVERLKEFVRLKQSLGSFGEVKEIFTDSGISAKDMNRPALRRLLSKIESKDIDLVLVTELSRFTRSIKDFSILWEFLEKHECKFLSIKDNFDTSTAAGELVMYMMANIAQFERKQTAERISHSFLARAKRGLYNGGSVPLGYEIDPEKPGHLRIKENEAEITRLVFKTFLDQETLAKTAKHLNRNSITLPRIKIGGGPRRSDQFRIDTVHRMLCNKAYLGIRSFKGKDGKLEETKASWPAIIDETLFYRAQELLRKNKFRKRKHLDKRYPYTLSGITFCGICGDRVAGKSAHGRNRKFPYYEHSWLSKRQTQVKEYLTPCKLHRVSAETAEPLVWKAVKEFLLNEECTKQLLAVARNIKPDTTENKQEVDVLLKNVKNAEHQIESLVERISKLPKDLSDEPFLNQLRRMQENKKSMLDRLQSLEVQRPTDVILEDLDFTRFADQFSSQLKIADQKPEIQTALIHKLIHRIEIGPEAIAVEFFVGKNRTKTGIDLFETQKQPTRPLSKFLKNSGSRKLTNGGSGGN